MVRGNRLRGLMSGRLAAASVAAAMLTGSCSGDESIRTALARAAKAHVAVDESFARSYAQAREEARARASSWEERDELVAPWEAAREALAALRGALLAADAAEGGELLDAAACAAGALSRLRAALRDAGHDPPAITSGAEAALRGLGGTCASHLPPRRHPGHGADGGLL